MISLDSFIGRVMRTSGLDAKDAHRATFATIRALGEVLDEPIVKALREELPRRMALMMLANAPHQQPAIFYSRVASHEGRSLGTAKEHSESVCRVLATALDHDLVVRIEKDLGRPSLFEPPPLPDVPPPHGIPTPPPAVKRTLATGKPGFEHPIAESAPPEHAHRHSVARSDNPHADRKLSTAHK